MSYDNVYEFSWKCDSNCNARNPYCPAELDHENSIEFLGLNERENVAKNVSELLEDVSFERIGSKVDVTDKDLEEAKIGARFVERFGITRIKDKQLKK